MHPAAAPSPASASTLGPALRSAALGLGLLLLATVCSLALDSQISLTSEAMLYVLAVVLAAYTLEPLPSALCALAAVLAFNFFFVPPRFTFAVDSHEHLIALLTMLVLALVISGLAAQLRRKTESARRSLLRAQQLQELAGELVASTSSDKVVALGQAALDRVFDGPNTLALRRPDGSLDFGLSLGDKLQEGMDCCMREAACLGPGTGRWPGLNAWYLPLGSKEALQGAVCIENVDAADQQGREHALALCSLLGQALQRLQMERAAQASQHEAARQQLQSTFLAAVSHDLRTPLAALLGAASALQTQGDRLGETERSRLLDSIASEAHYLASLTENTLQLVQLTSASHAAQPLQRSWESMEEIVGAVLHRVRLRDSRHRISLRVPKDLPLIEADPVLLAQLLSNLLDNAMQYSPGAIELQVQTREQQMQVSVKDRGEAIAPALQAQIFQPYARGDQSGTRGAGLGLALCRAIASAHGGSLHLRARQGGGNCFTLCLPLSPQQPLAGELP